jgi:hypothetical protein
LAIFKKYLVNFLLLHLTFAVILLLSYAIFVEASAEILSYLFWFSIMFGIVAALVQTVLFALALSKVSMHKFLLFAVILLIELVIVNLLGYYGNGGGDSLTGALIDQIRVRNTWENMSGSVLAHISILLACILITLTRSFKLTS